MKIVVDTNIVFSGILNSSSRIGKILVHSRKYIHFYSCDFLKHEIAKHRTKLIKLTNLDAEELDELTNLVLTNITFIHQAIIPDKIINVTESILSDIDVTDTPFVALADYLKAKLWTGDLNLVSGLKKKKIKNVITTSELLKLIEKREKKAV